MIYLSETISVVLVKYLNLQNSISSELLGHYLDLWVLWLWKYYLPRIPSALEKAMAPHSSTLAWKIPWAEEPGRLQSMRSLRVGHDWATSLSIFTFVHWRRKWQPTPMFFLGVSQGRGSLVSCHLCHLCDSMSHRVGHDWSDLAAAAAAAAMMCYF